MNFYKCSNCGIKLNGFEAGKWENLVEYWGGRMGNQKPLCVNCYHKELEEKKANAIKEMGKAHNPDNLLDAKRAGIVA